MPLLNDPEGTVVTPGSAFPRMLYGPNGLIVVVPTAADEAAAIQAGFSENPDPTIDYGYSFNGQDVQFSTFNYLSIARGRPKASEVIYYDLADQGDRKP